MNDSNLYETYAGSPVRSLLMADEEILWSGRPVPGKLFHKQDAVLIPFSIFWCGFAIFWEITAFSASASLIFPLFGLPFVAVGLYLVFGRFFTQQRRKRKTFYAVTSKRIIRVQGSSSDFITYDQIPSVSKQVSRDGSGSIFFGNNLYLEQMNISTSNRYHRQAATFFCLGDIPDADLVYQIISEQLLLPSL